LERFAKSMLEERDRFITEKHTPGPSGDLHDYHTAAPYWSEGGTFHDGIVQETRPDSDPSSSRFDRHCMLRLTRRCYGLAFSGRLMGRRDMLEKATDLLRAWFIVPATRMNPSCRYAQLLPHKNGPSATGIIEFREFSFLPYTLKLLTDDGALGERDAEEIRAWLRRFLSDCEANGARARSLELRNNIGTWADAIFSAISLASGDFDAAFMLARWCPVRLGMQLGPLSTQTYELERTRPLHYCLFNLSAWAAMARISGEFGLSIKDFVGCQGESLRSALGFCSDNRQRFSDYADATPSFDRWIGILEMQINSQQQGSRIHLVETPEWGLPPIVLPVSR
ncbi:MAG: alginate lyase family protein, partial [Planctomycetota bacterium]